MTRSGAEAAQLQGYKTAETTRARKPGGLATRQLGSSVAAVTTEFLTQMLGYKAAFLLHRVCYAYCTRRRCNFCLLQVRDFVLVPYGI